MAMQSSNILVIGLGGSGLKAATFVLKNVLEANNNQLPGGFGILVLDTENEIKFQAGGWGEERGKHHATGPVKIDWGQYLPLTGNLKQLGLSIDQEQRAAANQPELRRRQQRRHISSWFQAAYYLRDVGVNDSVWNLDVGAGQYRQFGRLGLFNHLTRIDNMLSSIIRAIKSSGIEQGLQVHITGSFAGGTGASLFIDLPHYIKQLAKQDGMRQTPVVIGHFVLGEAFRGTRGVQLANEGTERAFYARSQACLRELTRLQGTSLVRANGYPMVYDPTGSGKLNSRLETSPYTYVYLYDGHRNRNALHERELQEGLAPTIADVIMAYVDPRSGGAFKSHTVNFKAYYGAHNIPEGAVTYGSVGSYTIELPIYHITEGWTHRLAQRFFEVLLAPQLTANGDIRLEGGSIVLKEDEPGGNRRDPAQTAEGWTKEGGVTGLVSKLIAWGQKGRRARQLHDQTVSEILSYDAIAWQQDLAPTGATFQDYVAEAREDLRGSFKNKESRYFVEHDQGGSTALEKGHNLVQAIEQQMIAMVGMTQGSWERDGGNFRRSLVRLANYHRIIFEETLIQYLLQQLNGTEAGSPRERKQGKLGFVIAFVRELHSMLVEAQTILADAAKSAASRRRDLYLSLEQELRERQDKMNSGSGLFGGNLRAYRDKADDVAQFYKADIARLVIHDLVKHLVATISQIQTELDAWERRLARVASEYGGAYNLLQDGRREIAQDRQRSKNAARWVIEDREASDTYIEDRYKRYVDGQLEKILNLTEWRVGKTDAGEWRVDFTTNKEVKEQSWDRRAGKKGEKVAGQKNLTYLLEQCRAVFDPAWSEMSVTEYLFQNFDDKEADLAKRVYDASGYLLETHGVGEPPMRSTYMRVFKDGLTTQMTSFLDRLLHELGVLFHDTSSATERAEQIKAANGEYAPSLTDSAGQNSVDRFKLTFLMFGDLLQLDQINHYVRGRARYREYSNQGDQWRALHILPAETNALQIERGLEATIRGGRRQRRREFSEDVVASLEDADAFQLAMRCLAYGETDFVWPTGERGLLLHLYSEPGTQHGYRYWRLTLSPHGSVRDGQIIGADGRLAGPVHYQLSSASANPDLWEAVLQLVAVGRDLASSAAIAPAHVEETVRYAMELHLQRCNEAGILSWSPRPEHQHDHAAIAEGHDRAAQIIRLNSLIDKLDQDLNLHTWAWQAGAEGAPEELEKDPRRKNETQRSVDLRTALRWTAEEERKALNVRFVQLGQWRGQEPRQPLRLTPPHSPSPLSAAEGWPCPNCNFQNASNANFCDDCGQPRPAAPDRTVASVADKPPIATPQPFSPEIQKQLDSAKSLLDAGLISQEQYNDMVRRILVAVTPITPEMQKQIDNVKNLLDTGIIQPAQYEEMVARIKGGRA